MMSQFDHESDDQSRLANEEVRKQKEFRSGAEIMHAYRQEREFQERRDAYRGPHPKEHLQDELYRSIAGAVAHFQSYLEHAPLSFLDKERSAMIAPPTAREHFTRSLHAMVFQELDLYRQAQRDARKKVKRGK